MPRLTRLDAELVRRGLARSREHASELIRDGRVTVAGTTAQKPATGVGTDVAVVVTSGDTDDWASRGAHKLLGALAAFTPRGLAVDGRRCLDAGASTGGFTDVLLRHGAAHVVAADVGYGQLVWRLRSDDRVTVLDRTNVRALTPDDIGGVVDVVVSDLSFISLRLVLPALAACAAPDADLVLMVKPQFEVGRERIGAGGVVRSREHRVDAVLGVVRAAAEAGLALHGAVASPLPGPSGNVEYFVWLRRAPDRLRGAEAGADRAVADHAVTSSTAADPDGQAAENPQADVAADRPGGSGVVDVQALVRAAVEEGPE